jgi:hypothetical protein
VSWRPVAPRLPALSSWKLFVHSLAFWDAFENPVFLRDIRRQPIWYGLARRVAAFPGLALGLVGALSLGWAVMSLYLGTLWVWLLLALLVLVVMTSAALGPIVVEERVKGRWDVLLATPSGVEHVLLGKVGGALWWIRYLIIALAALLALLAAGVGFVSLVLIPTSLTHLDQLPIFFLCGAAVVLPIASAILFVIDRTQQYLLMIVAATTVSASSASMRAAFATSVAAVLLAWIAEFVLAAALLALQAGPTRLADVTYMLAVAVLGPMAGYIVDMDLAHAALYTAGTLLLREIALDTLWRWSLRKARA